MVVATAAAVLTVVWAAWGLARTPEPEDSKPASTGAVAAASPPAVVSDPPSRGDQAAAASTPTKAAPPASAPAPSPDVAPLPRPPDALTPPPRSPAPGRERRGPPAPKPPAPRPAEVTATYSVSQVWQDGFQSSISLENTSPEPLTVVLTLSYPGGVSLPEVPDCWWDVTCSQVGNTITLTTTTALEPGTRRFIGFNAERPAGPAPFDPVSCTVNGSPCDGF